MNIRAVLIYISICKPGCL